MKELVRIAEKLLEAACYKKEIYCTLIGECFVQKVDKEREEIIATLVQKADNERMLACDEYGRPCGNTDAECCVFPSKDNRDWSTFDATPRYDISELKPFDKVLARRLDAPFGNKTWQPNLYSKYNSDKRLHECVIGFFKECVPYNDETKHLLGTTDEAPNFYRTWKSDNKDSE